MAFAQYLSNQIKSNNQQQPAAKPAAASSGFMQSAQQSASQRTADGGLYPYQQRLLENYGNANQTPWQKQTAQALMAKQAASGGSSAPSVDLSGITSGINGLGTQMTSGFNTVNSNLQTGFGTVNDNLQSGFGQMDNRFNGVQNQVQSGFEQTAGLMGQYAGQLNSGQQDILSGQTGINDLLQNTSDRLDTYYSGLADGQAGLSDQLGGMQSGLDTFYGDYETDTTLAQGTRADLQTALGNGVERIRSDISTQGNLAAEGQAKLMQAVAGPGFAAPQVTSTGGGTQPAAQGLAAQPQQQQTSPINAVRTVLQRAGQQLPPDVRGRFSAVAAAFNEAGQLIPQQQMQDGSVVQRQLGQDGNLNVARVGQNGQVLGNGTFNVNQVLAEAKNLFQRIS